MDTLKGGHLGNWAVISCAQPTLKSFSTKPPTLTGDKKRPHRYSGDKLTISKGELKAGFSQGCKMSFQLPENVHSRATALQGVSQGAEDTQQSIPTTPGRCLRWIFPGSDNPCVPEPPAVQKGNNSEITLLLLLECLLRFPHKRLKKQRQELGFFLLFFLTWRRETGCIYSSPL